MHADTLLHPQWIIPVAPANAVLEAHSLAIHNGRISALLPRAEAREQIRADEVIELPGQALIPGLVNAHTHAAMSLFRGLADDLPLMDWLNDHIWPAERVWVHEEFVAAGTRLAAAEMIRSGTTCFNDMYFFPDVSARVLAQTGLRAVLGLIVIDFPTQWADDADGYFARASEVHDQLKGQTLLSPAFAPHSPYAVGDASLQRLLTLSNELDLPIHMHVHETDDEIRQGLEQHGCRPIERLQRLGLIEPNLAAVHMTHLQDDEIATFASQGASVVHCPESNLKLAAGFCPVARLLEAGINVALGTDGAASNNDLDMLGEMHSAALLGKGVANDASALPAHQVLEMATLNGARALGLADEIGTLTVGKAADVVAIDLTAIETQPVYHPLSQIVYAAGREQVSHVWVNGRCLLKQRQLTSLDLADIRTETQAWQARISNHPGNA